MYGDGFPEDNASVDSLDIINHSPLFTAVLVGGFHKSLEHRITTAPSAVDPVVTLLVAHLCATEFGVQSLKSQIKVRILSIKILKILLSEPLTYHTDLTDIFLDQYA